MNITRKQIGAAFTERVEIDQGANYLDVYQALGCADDWLPFVVMEINGELVTDWHQVTVRENDQAVFALVPQGGDNKGILGAIATIALSLAAGPAVGFLMDLGMSKLIATAVFTVGASMVLSMAANAFIKPPRQPALAPEGKDFYTLTGTSNRANPYGTVKRVYGRYRVYPDLAAQPVTQISGLDQYLIMLFDFGYGPLNVMEPRLGNTGLANFADAQVKIHREYRKGDPLKFYTTDTATLPQSATLTTGQAITRTIGRPADQLGFDISFPEGLANIDRGSGNPTERSVAIDIEYREAGTGGAWIPWTQGLEFISGSTDHITGLNQVYIQGQVYGEILVNRPGREPDTLGYRPGTTVFQAWFPRGYKYNSGETWFMELQGWIAPVKTVYQSGQQQWTIETLEPLPYEIVLNPNLEYYYEDLDAAVRLRTVSRARLVITESRLKPFAVSFTLGMPSAANWELRFTKVTQEGDQYQPDKTVLTAIRSMATVNLPFAPDVPHTIAELRIKATDQLNGVVDDFNAICTSVLPVWDGEQWTNQETRNPAWIYADLFRGNANQRRVTDARLNLDELLAWADECETPAPNDPNGPAFCCDLVISSQSTVLEAAQLVASTGRAAPAIRDGKYTVIRENPDAVPVQLITPKNSSNLTASMDYIQPPDALRVKYVDCFTWERAELLVYNDGKNEGNAEIFEDLELPGVTVHNQAWRAGRYYLAEGTLRRERATVSMDVEYLIAQRGDLVTVAHDVLNVGGAPRYITAVEGNRITVDEPLTGGLTGVRKRGSLDVIQVTLATDPRQFNAPDGHNLAEGDLIEYGVSESILADYLVESIRPGANLSATLHLIEHRPEVLDAITGNIPPRIPKPGAGITAYISEPINAKAAAVLTVNDARAKYYEIGLTWQPPRNGVPYHYLVYEISQNSGQRVYQGKTKKQTWAADSVAVSTVATTTERMFEIVAVDFAGNQGPPATVTTSYKPDKTPPPNVTGFGVNALTEKLLLFWEMPPGEDVQFYEIRYSADLAANWFEASVLAYQISYLSTETTAPVRPGKYFIKAVDSSKNYSQEAAEANIHIEELERVDLFTVFQFDPFTDQGSFLNTRVENGALVLEPGFLEGWFFPYAGIAFADPVLVRLLADVKLIARSENELLNAPWFETLANASPLSPTANGANNTAEAQVFFDLGAVSIPMLDDPYYETLANADPLRGRLATDDVTRLLAADVKAKEINFGLRLRTKDPQVTPAVLTASVTADWVERTETGQDLTAPGATTETVLFTNPFAKPPAVAITLQNAPDNAQIIKSNVTNRGFDIRVTPGGAVFDYVALGYGKGY